MVSAAASQKPESHQARIEPSAGRRAPRRDHEGRRAPRPRRPRPPSRRSGALRPRTRRPLPPLARSRSRALRDRRARAPRGGTGRSWRRSRAGMSHPRRPRSRGVAPALAAGYTQRRGETAGRDEGRMDSLCEPRRLVDGLLHVATHLVQESLAAAGSDSTHRLASCRLTESAIRYCCTPSWSSRSMLRRASSAATTSR